MAKKYRCQMCDKRNALPRPRKLRKGSNLKWRVCQPCVDLYKAGGPKSKEGPRELAMRFRLG